LGKEGFFLVTVNTVVFSGDMQGMHEADVAVSSVSS